jgi:hypothetical protein
MDKHLVYLVKQTEKYGEKLVKGMKGDRIGGDMTVEEVLLDAEKNGTGGEGYKRRGARVDYKRLVLEAEEIYGESTADEGSSGEEDEEWKGGEVKDDEREIEMDQEEMGDEEFKQEVMDELEGLKKDQER